MSKPARPDLRFRSVDDLSADIERLRANGYDASGAWDLPMIVNHLRRILEASTQQTIKRANPLTRALARQAMNFMTRRDRYIGIKVPALKAIRPTRDANLDEDIPRVLAAARQIADKADTPIDTPLFGIVRGDEFFHLQMLHAAHHLSFLQPRG